MISRLQSLPSGHTFGCTAPLHLAMWYNCPYALNTHFTQCHHRKPPFQLPPMPSIHISPHATISNPLFNCPPCPQYTFHPAPPNPLFNCPPLPSKHISPSATTSNPFFNCPPCPQYTFHPVPPSQTPISTAPILGIH